MTIKKSDLYGSIWASCDKLRGGMDERRYVRIVPLDEVASERNDYNLNLSRYIDSSEPEDMPPTLKEQQEIVSIFSDMDTEITAFEARFTKTRTLKQAMMQELLAGRTRLLSFNQEDLRYV